MKPQTDTFCLIIIVVLLASLIYVDPAVAQQRSTRPRRTRPAQTKRQPRVTPTPKPPLESEAELAAEQEVALLFNLSAGDKATVLAAIKGLDRTLRLWELKGYDERWVYRTDTFIAEQRVKAATAALPESSMTRRLLTGAWQTITDARTAEQAYYRGGSVYDDILLKIIDKYRLRGVTGAEVPRTIYQRAADMLSSAAEFAMRAGIIPPMQ